ncbi:peptidoglycan-binding domain-containing protein, partial [Bacillus salitolerans]
MNGKFDKKTEDAVRKFEAYSGYNADGIAGWRIKKDLEGFLTKRNENITEDEGNFKVSGINAIGIMHGIAEELWSSVKESFALIHSFDDMIYQTAKLTSSIVSGEITIQDIQDGLKSSLKEEFVEPFEYIKKHGKDLDSATYKESKEFGH